MKISCGKTVESFAFIPSINLVWINLVSKEDKPCRGYELYINFLFWYVRVISNSFSKRVDELLKI